MNKHGIISIVIVLMLILIPAFASAALTSSFGGKVLTPNLAIATCTGFGTGPVALTSNLLSFGSAVIAGTGLAGQGQSTATRVGGVVSGLYGAIPFYTQYGVSGVGGFHFVGAVPKAGDWILGRANVIPNFSTCVVTGTGTGGGAGIPFPVRTTNNYKTSSNSSGGGF